LKRITLNPRPDWQERVEKVGFLWHTVEGRPYWNESAAYEFTMAEVLKLEGATNELQERVIEAVEIILERDWFSRMGIGAQARQLIIDSWRREPADLSLYGRFDLAWNGTGEPKMLEYNADTPTSLMEAAVIQWYWLQDLFPQNDQFNSLHERLIERWGQLKKTGIDDLHLACMESEEDLGTLRYVGDCAAQAGIRVIEHLRMNQIGRRGAEFVDMSNRRIHNCFKLYPWEWMLRDENGQYVTGARWIEPAWKMLLSNKAILPILWELFPSHPNLLRASFEPLDGDYVRKPYWAREGANVTLHLFGRETSTEGRYADQPMIYQKYYPLPSFGGCHPVIGSWIIGEEAGGMGIREDAGLVTGNLSRFVPHYIG
jgi:glutathionylspermidine synthase